MTELRRYNQQDLGWISAAIAAAPAVIKGVSSVVSKVRSKAKPGRKPPAKPGATYRLSKPTDRVAWGNGTVTVQELHELARESALKAQAAGQALEASQRELRQARSLKLPLGLAGAGLLGGYLLARSRRRA